LAGKYAFPFGEGGTPKGVTEEVKTQLPFRHVSVKKKHFHYLSRFGFAEPPLAMVRLPPAIVY